MGKILDSGKQDTIKVIIALYNFLNDAEIEHQSEIPHEVFLTLSSMDYREICRPLIINDYHNGQNLNQVCIKYRLPKSFCRGVGQSICVLKSVRVGE